MVTDRQANHGGAPVSLAQTPVRVWKMPTRSATSLVALLAYEVAFGKHRAAFQLAWAFGLRGLFKSSREPGKRGAWWRRALVDHVSLFSSVHSQTSAVLAFFRDRSCYERRRLLGTRGFVDAQTFLGICARN